MPAGPSLEPATGFAAGTSIRTPAGEVAVETLVPGDVVVTPSGLREVRRVVCAGEAPRPIRVAVGAFGAGAPARDIVLAPHHGVLVTCVDEMLAPVVDLVNGGTVVAATAAELWDVILDSHDILVANGLRCESHRSPGGSSCRPVCDDRLVVHAVRTRLRDWALEAGWRVVPMDADLHLEVDGARVEGDPFGDRIRFIVPAGAYSLWLVSRHFVPADLGLSADPRRLGVQIMEIAVDDGLGEARHLPIEDPSLSLGFHVAEPADAGCFRWTDGRARLPDALWQGCQGSFFLKLRYSSQSLVRWQPPA